jgi:polyisoprenoid-binding protein YceI
VLPQSDPEAGSSRRRTVLLVAVAAAALLVVGVGAWWLTRDDAPAEADLGTATASLSDDEGEAEGDGAGPGADQEAGGSGTDDETAPGTGDDPDPAPAGVDGDWRVDSSVGEFSFEDSTGTFVGFRVREELTGLGEVEAVGRTPQVTGSVTIDGQTVTTALVEANMAAITTNDGRRDNRVRSALDVEQFPTATFELTTPIDLGPEAGSGEPVAATASGDLTVHGVTQPVEFDLQAQLVDDTIVIVGALDVVFGDFGVEVPSAPVVLSADDFGVVELQLFLARS